MDSIINDIVLFVAAMFWGYFDFIRNLCFELKMKFYDKRQTQLIRDKTIKKEEALTFFETDNAFKVSSVVTMFAFIFVIIAAFYMPFNHILIIGFGFFMGRLIPTQLNFFERITGQEDVIGTIDKSILFGNIYITYFTLYPISVILTA